MPQRQVDALCLLSIHPSISARQFAGLFWPHLRGQHVARLAAEHLGVLVNQGLVRKRMEPRNFIKPTLDTPQPKYVYYLTDLGYEVNEYWRRQRQP